MVNADPTNLSTKTDEETSAPRPRPAVAGGAEFRRSLGFVSEEGDPNAIPGGHGRSWVGIVASTKAKVL